MNPIRRFIASTRGVAAVEFAMIAPVLATLFLGTFDGARAIATYMKMRSATFAFAAISNQYSMIQASDMTTIVGAASSVMAPYSSSPMILQQRCRDDQLELLARCHPSCAGSNHKPSRNRA